MFTQWKPLGIVFPPRSLAQLIPLQLELCKIPFLLTHGHLHPDATHTTPEGTRGTGGWPGRLLNQERSPWLVLLPFFSISALKFIKDTRYIALVGGWYSVPRSLIPFSATDASQGKGSLSLRPHPCDRQWRHRLRICRAKISSVSLTWPISQGSRLTISHQPGMWAEAAGNYRNPATLPLQAQEILQQDKVKRGAEVLICNDAVIRVPCKIP